MAWWVGGLFPVGKRGMIQVEGSASRISNNHNSTDSGGGDIVPSAIKSKPALVLPVANSRRPSMVPECTGLPTVGKPADDTFTRIDQRGCQEATSSGSAEYGADRSGYEGHSDCAEKEFAVATYPSSRGTAGWEEYAACQAEHQVTMQLESQ